MRESEQRTVGAAALCVVGSSRGNKQRKGSAQEGRVADGRQQATGISIQRLLG